MKDIEEIILKYTTRLEDSSDVIEELKQIINEIDEVDLYAEEKIHILNDIRELPKSDKIVELSESDNSEYLKLINMALNEKRNNK